MSKTELIDKRMLIDAFNRVAMFHHETHIPMVEHDFRELINNMPTVDAVLFEKHGNWIDTGPGECKCSVCGHVHYIRGCARSKASKCLTKLCKYCSNCGAKMDGKDGTK